MVRLPNSNQAINPAPWRKQVKFIIAFFVVLIVVTLAGLVYLTRSANTTAVGRQIFLDREKIDEIDREIEDLQTRLAKLRSAEQMEKRAKELGFEPIPPENIVYLPVEGYVGRRPAVLAPRTQPGLIPAPVVPSEYTESLFDWVRRTIGPLILMD